MRLATSGRALRSYMLALICVFCSMITSALYGYAREPGGLTGILDLIAAYISSAAVALWVYRDAAARGKRLPYDFASFVFFLWLVAAPVYLFRTRGWRAVGPISIFVVMSIVALLFEMLLLSQRGPTD